MNNNKQSSAVAIYNTPSDAEAAVKELQTAGIDMKLLSIVGKDYRTEDHVVGYYKTGGRLKYWGKLGTFWGGIWSLLKGEAFFWMPGVGPILSAVIALETGDVQRFPDAEHFVSYAGLVPTARQSAGRKRRSQRGSRGRGQYFTS